MTKEENLDVLNHTHGREEENIIIIAFFNQTDRLTRCVYPWQRPAE